MLVDLKPVGEGYMEDFHAAGGVGAVLRELRPLLHLDTIDVEGRTLAERLDEPLDWVDREVIRPFDDPVSPVGGLIALNGSARAGRRDLQARGGDARAVRDRGPRRGVHGPGGPGSRIDDPDLDVTPDDVLVLQNAGPHAAGMPEAGYLPIPKKLAQAGREGHGAHLGRAHVGHGLRHDRAARRAGGGGRRPAGRGAQRRPDPALGRRTSASTCWSSRSEIRKRLEGFQPPPVPARGYQALYRRTVLQAPDGCDFDFLTAEK